MRHLSQCIYLLVVLLTTLPLRPQNVQSSSSGFTFTTVDFPQALATHPSGINARGDIVGDYYLPIGQLAHGFLLRNGTFSTLDYPGATDTEATSVNSQGIVAGTYNTLVGLQSFLFNNGEFTKLTVPGASAVHVRSLSNTGAIVGDYMPSPFNGIIWGGFVYDGGAIHDINYPGSAPGSTHPTSIDSSGDIVGVLGSGGFLLRRGTYNSLNVPGSTSTVPKKINDRGDIVGSYSDSTGVHGFLLRGGKFTSIDVPGAASTCVSGINEQGNITVGGYTDFHFSFAPIDGCGTHGFVATPTK